MISHFNLDFLLIRQGPSADTYQQSTSFANCLLGPPQGCTIPSLMVSKKALYDFTGGYLLLDPLPYSATLELPDQSLTHSHCQFKQHSVFPSNNLSSAPSNKWTLPSASAQHPTSRAGWVSPPLWVYRQIDYISPVLCSGSNCGA